MSDDKKKRGRPVSGNTKNNVVSMRVDDETRNMLNDICEKYGVSKPELIERWARNQYKMMENGIDLL